VDDHAELARLQAEIRELLAAALGQDAEHEAELRRRDELHVAESDRRDQLHEAELRRRDELHTSESDRRDELHVAELERRDQLHVDEMALLTTALQSRDVIGQAKGIIMVTMGCSADEAFDLLRQQSQHENRKLVENAAELADRTQRTRRAG
jgi:G3E family GTPase